MVAERKSSKRGIVGGHRERYLRCTGSLGDILKGDVIEQTPSPYSRHVVMFAIIIRAWENQFLLKTGRHIFVSWFVSWWLCCAVADGIKMGGIRSCET